MRSNPRLFSLAVVAAMLALPATAAPWKWDAGFTAESSEELKAIHHQIHGSTAITSQDLGVPVKDVTFEAETFSIHIKEGHLWVEPEIEDYPVGAFFEGRATVSYAPASRKARGDMEYFFQKGTLEDEPIEFAYFYTLRGASILEQLGIEGEPVRPLGGASAYANCKLAIRQLGLSLTEAFLNRNGYGHGTTHVLFAPPSIRGPNSRNAYLLYSFDPSKKMEVYLSVFGHGSLISDADYRHFFYIVARSRSKPRRYRPQGAVDEYIVDLSLAGTSDATQTTAIAFTPSNGVAALSLGLTPRMQVESVTGPEGEPFPFLQWEFLPSKTNFDEYLLVDLGDTLRPDEPYELTVNATGPLFDPFYNRYNLASSTFYLVEEDNWHPRIQDPTGAVYTMRITVPKRQRAVAAGTLVSEEVLDGKRRYEFKSPRPTRRATLYYGEFRTILDQADGTAIEVYAQHERVDHAEINKTAKEVANMVRVYNRIFRPLELESLRVAGTPTRHGRGFEGLVLISEGGFRNSSYSEVFLAHEVAHQWWGNLVDGKNWPEDRWLSEAFAEYSAMEYFKQRYDKPEKARMIMRELWAKPVLRAPREPVSTVTGETRRIKTSEINALIDGGGNVYSKGPLVIHTLRYYFELRTGSDDAFWSLLRDFLDKYAYGQAGTEDFIRLAEEHLGEGLDWFRTQWIYGTAIPVVRWSYDVNRTEDGRWLLTVEAQQEKTNYLLAIPIYIEGKRDEVTTHPLFLLGEKGQAQVTLTSKPTRVTLNENFEALVQLKR